MIEIELIRDTRSDYIAEMLFISASNRVLKKQEKSWMQKMQKYKNKKESLKMTKKEKQKYTKDAFRARLKAQLD